MKKWTLYELTTIKRRSQKQKYNFEEAMEEVDILRTLIDKEFLNLRGFEKLKVNQLVKDLIGVVGS